MTTVASTVGAFTLPIPAGVADSPLEDPLIVGLLAYLGHWIKWGLDAKLANLTGPSPTITTNDACPTGSRYAFNPGQWWVRAVGETGMPVLCIWNQSSRRFRWSSIYDIRERSIGIFYAFPQVQTPRGFRTREGLIQAVDAIVRRALDRGAHPTYENGVQFVDTIADPNTLDVFLDTAEEGFEASVPSTESRAQSQPNEGFEQYGYPTLRGVIVARERVSQDSFEDPDDNLGDATMTMTINGLGDVADGLTVLEGVLPGPDGSEDGNEVV